jgi:ComF family protein
LKASQWLKSVQFWLLPGICVVCRQPSGREADLCRACLRTLARIDRPCLSCALPLPPGDQAGSRCGRCIGRARRLTRTVAAFAYTEPASTLITGFKYRAALQQGLVLSELLIERLREEYRTQALPELLVPVPLHPVRLRERGFNQALVVAQHLGKALQIPVTPDLMRRVRQTPPQQGLGAKSRRYNLRGAFQLQDGTVLKGCTSIALVDDVVTTMSTVNELARLLRRHCKNELDVHVWCLARA